MIKSTDKFIGCVEKKLHEILEDLEKYTNDSINAHFKCSDYSKEECRMNYIKGNLIKFQVTELINRIKFEKEYDEMCDLLNNSI